jgi:hypothetical protein
MLKAFYESVLPTTGRFCLWQKVRGPQWHTWYESIDELVAETEQRIDTQGLYFGTAGFGDQVNEDGEYVRKLENVTALRAFRFDIDAGAEKHAKHPNDTYPTQRDALAAVIAFIKATGLMPTWIVSSGEGLHVYWALDADVDRAWWTPVARSLNAAGRANGLRVDGGITVDAARILRPLGTPHKNGTRVTPLKHTGKTYDPEAFAAAVRALAPEQDDFDLAAARAPARTRSLNDDMLAVEGPPASLARVADHCSAVALMRDAKGNVPEPHWRAVMGVAKYCEDGEQLVHEWSSGYDGYSRRETQEKFDRWETPPTTCQHFSLMHSGCNTCPYRSKITTPKQVGYLAVKPDETPVTIPDAGTSTAPSAGSPSPQADESPSDASIESGLALPDEEASAECPVPERPDLFDETGAFFFKVVENRWTLFHRYKEKTKDATGQDVWLEHVKPVAYKLFWIDSNSLPGATDTGGVLLTFGRVERPGSTRQDRMDMPGGTTADLKALCKWLADQGINLAPASLNKNSALHVMEYVSREKIRKQNDMRFVIKDRFGYHFHEGQFICSMGQYTVYPDGVVLKTICNTKLVGLSKSLCTTALEDKPGGRWEPGVWRDVAPAVANYIQFLRKHYGHEGYQLPRLALAINLASPYLVFAADSVFDEAEDMPATGFILSLYSEQSGIGKSSLMTALAAAYGKDTLNRKGNDASITAVAAATLAKGTAIYPFLLDEVTQNDAQRTAALIDTFANGIGRVRASSNGDVSRPAATWALVSTVATNVPQRELLTAQQKRSDALLMRLLELNFDSIPAAGDIEAFRADLKEVQRTCGAFGMFQALLAVKAGHARLTEMTAANVSRAFELLEVGQQFRFFARMLGAMLTNHELLGKWSPFDMDEIIETFKQAIKETTWYVQANKSTPTADLSSLLSHVAANVVVTKTWTKRGSRANPDEKHDVVLNPNVKMPLLGREVQEWGQILIDVNAVRKWCLDNQMSATAFVKRMADCNLLVMDGERDKSKQRLTTGLVGMPTTIGYYYRFRTRPAEAAAGGSNVVELRPTDAEDFDAAEEATA